MLYKNIFLLNFIFIFFNLYSHLADVVIAFDNEEKIGGAVQETALLTLCQKAAPLITTSHIAYIIAQLISKNHEFTNKINLAQDFQIFKSRNGKYYLFIPKNYKDKVSTKYLNDEFIKKTQDSGLQIKPIDIILGFNFDQLEEIHIKQFLEIQDNKDIDVLDLMNLFLKGKSEIFPLWNIYLIGHGYFSRDLIQNISMYSLMRTNIGANTKIAGMYLNEFRDLIQSFIFYLNVNLFYYLSCYAGDINMILPYMTNLINPNGIAWGREKPNFNIVTGSLTSIPAATTSRLSLAVCNNLKSAEDKKIINFSDYFESLRKYTDDTKSIRTIYNDQQLSEIFNNITPFDKLRGDETDIARISALPSIMFPNTDTFRAIPLNDKIGILSNVELKKSILEQKPIIFSNKQVILIYPQEISTEVIINTDQKVFPIIVVLQPGISLLKIDSLQTNLNLTDLLNNFDKVKPAFNKYVYIKELISGGKQYNDIIIFLSRDIVSIKTIYTIENDIFLRIGGLNDQHIGKLKKFSDNSFINSLINYFEIEKKNYFFFKFDKLLTDLSREDKELLSNNEIQSLIRKELDKQFEAKKVQEFGNLPVQSQQQASPGSQYGYDLPQKNQGQQQQQATPKENYGY